MQKIKSLNISKTLSIIKSCLLAIVTTLVGVVLLAVTLKFVDLSTALITWINNAIKAVSIFVMIMSIKRNNGEKLLLKSIFAGVLYALLTYVIFSILNGEFSLNVGLIYDVIFAVIVSVIAAIILNLFSRKSA